MNRLNDPTRSNDSSIIILNLATVLDFKIPERKNKENIELDLETGDETIKLK
jgi:hypothetical protein